MQNIFVLKRLYGYALARPARCPMPFTFLRIINSFALPGLIFISFPSGGSQKAFTPGYFLMPRGQGLGNAHIALEALQKIAPGELASPGLLFKMQRALEGRKK